MSQKNTTKWKFTVPTLTPHGVDTRTIMQARGHAETDLRAGAVVTDPVTGRTAQVYDRGITPKMIEVLALIYYYTKHNRTKHVSAAELKTRGGDYGKLRHWGLIEQKQLPKGGTKPQWRITEKGIRFVEGETRIPKKVLVFNDRRVGFVDDQTVSFEEIMGGFDLTAVLARKGVS